MADREAFVPVYTPDPSLRTAQQRVADVARRKPRDPGLRNKSFSAAVGGTYRVTAVTNDTIVTLPKADASTYGETITIFVEAPSSASVTMVCPTGDVQGGASDSITTTRVRVYYSNGAGRWSRDQ